MFSTLEILLLLATCLYLIYKYLTRNNDYFIKRNIPHEKPFLWFGNQYGTLFGTEAILDSLKRIDKKFVDQKIYGMFDVTGPVIVLRDPELIKKVTVKEADHFLNHRELLTEKDDPMFGNTVFMMHDEKWKDMRSTLTPAFTGNKMRIMFDLIRECCEDTVNYLKNELTSHPDGIDLDLKDFFTRFTNDVIATSAFGIKVNSLKDRDNEFYLMGKKINTFSGWVAFKFFLFLNFRFFARASGMTLFDKKHVGFFKNIVLDSMKYRKENNIVRPDIINNLMEAQKASDKKRDWTDNELVAQCFGFFMAGFETTGITLCFAATELMINQDVQEKLMDEVDEVQKQLDGKPLTYEVLQSMKYLDMVMSETLRKWSAAPVFDRSCNKSFVLEADDELKIPLKVGDTCVINVIGLHFDPNNFPDPDKFDPDRFSDENKSNIKPYTYLPFGAGPRSCIGNRFAIMETKAILYYLLCNFKFEISKKSKLPIQMEKKGFQLKPIGGFWMKLSSRN